MCLFFCLGLLWFLSSAPVFVSALVDGSHFLVPRRTLDVYTKRSRGSTGSNKFSTNEKCPAEEIHGWRGGHLGWVLRNSVPIPSTTKVIGKVGFKLKIVPFMSSDNV